jgi:outer membrane receptor for ferrienterochelin and colicins
MTRHTRNTRTLSVLAGLSALAAALATARPARADDASDLEGLLNETVVTTASKSAETGTTAPATSTTITAEDLRRYGIHSLDEAIDFLSLGVVTQNPLKAVEVGGRGVLLPNDHGDHLLLLVNGHAVNDGLFGGADFGPGLGIPLEMIDHIEVVLGPGSVLYGSNAMLGVINVITKHAKDWKGAHAVVESEIAKSYRFVGGFGAQFELLGKPVDATLGVTYTKQDGPPLLYNLEYGGVDPVTGKGVRYSRGGPENGYWGGVARNGYYSRIPAAFLRLEWGDFELNVHAKAYKRAVPYRSRYDNDFFDFDDPDTYEIDRHVWADLRHRARLSPVVELTSRVYADSWDFQSYHNTSEASACLSAGDATVATCQFYSPGVSRWAGAELRTSFDWFKDDRFVTLVGVDGRLRTASFKIDSLDFATGRHLSSSIGVIDRQDSVASAYAQQTWTPASWLGLNGGVRLDKQTRFDGVFSPRLAANVRAWSGGTLRAVYAEAFRAPSIIESDLANPIQIHAGDLRPERVRSVEGSLEQRFGRQRVLFGVFRSWWSDLVELHVLSERERRDAVAAGQLSLLSFGAAQFRNVSAIDNYGFNAAYEGALGEGQALKYGVNATASIARRSETGLQTEPLAVAPSLFGNARVAYDLPGALPTIALSAHYVNKRPADRAYDGGWPVVPYAPPQLTGRVTVTGGVPWVKGLSYRGSVDASLSDRGPYVVGPAQTADDVRARPLSSSPSIRCARRSDYNTIWFHEGGTLHADRARSPARRRPRGRVARGVRVHRHDAHHRHQGRQPPPRRELHGLPRGADGAARLPRRPQQLPQQSELRADPGLHRSARVLRPAQHRHEAQLRRPLPPGSGGHRHRRSPRDRAPRRRQMWPKAVRGRL